MAKGIGRIKGYGKIAALTCNHFGTDDERGGKCIVEDMLVEGQIRKDEINRIYSQHSRKLEVMRELHMVCYSWLWSKPRMLSSCQFP